MRRATTLLLLLAACQGKTADSGVPAPRASGTVIESESLSSRDVSVRRKTARNLSRIADARSAEQLLPALADEDSEVSTWAAYGLGYACRGREQKTVHALVARAASLPESSAGSELASPSEAIADALGRCGGSEAESTLRNWLRGPTARAEAAALGLGRLASNSGKLEDTTLVALLESPLRYALFPLTRLGALNASTSDRAREICGRLLTEHAPQSDLAVRVLARTGEAGSARLGELLAEPAVDAGLKAQAARELSTLGAAGQRPLWAAFDRIANEPPTNEALTSASYGSFVSVLDALTPPISSSGSKLQALSELALGESDSPSLTRRKVHLRCTAAALLAGPNPQSARLVACDPTKESEERELGVLRVLGREQLRGSRKTAFLARARDERARVREAALELLAQHNELPEAYQVLAEALGSKSLGVVASAAHVLASYPERATRGEPGSAPNPDPSVVKALSEAYATARAKHNIEVQSSLLDAIGALQLLSLKDVSNQACSSDNPTLREHAQKALRLLGEQTRRCDDFKPGPGNAATAAERSLLTLETDAGTLTLTLDPTYAPAAVARVVALAQAGFYDGLVVHRVVPGFVAQFGDPGGDGYGGDDQPPLRCETSPIPFRAQSIGVALSGRDTGSSQLFVMLGRYPHLDGQYAWLGQAGPGWDRVAVGDRIGKVRVGKAP